METENPPDQGSERNPNCGFTDCLKQKAERETNKKVVDVKCIENIRHGSYGPSRKTGKVSAPKKRRNSHRFK